MGPQMHPQITQMAQMGPQMAQMHPQITQMAQEPDSSIRR
jgi:hypothetical protein